jgi:hypothetical protein
MYDVWGDRDRIRTEDTGITPLRGTGSRHGRLQRVKLKKFLQIGKDGEDHASVTGDYT